MSSAKPKEIPKGNPKSGGGGGSANKAGNRGKGDIKSDKVDLNPKIQATAEQMQIARIIESHRSEDPELQRKIKQVIEITGSTPDAASMALHSRDNNLEEAITLLTEGGTESLELEWEQAGKKKKIKSAAQKADAAKELAGQRKDRENGPGGRDRNDKRNDTRPDRGGDRDRTTSTSEAQQGEGFFEGRRGGRGRGRGDSRGGRGGGIGRGGLRVENKENDESNDVGGSGGYGSRFSNGPMRGRGRGGGRGGFRGGDRDRDPSRTFANRSRGPREGDFGHHPIDVWENSQADTTKADAKPNLKVDQWTDFPQTEDWDNEEYTGSLAETKVFVPSAQQSASEGAPVSQTTPPNGETILATDTTSNGIGGPTNHLGSAAGHVVAGQSIDLSLLLSKQTPTVSAPNAGANLLASIQSSYSTAAAQQISQPLMPRPKVSPSQPQQPGGAATGGPRQAQRTVPSTKIPTTGVEMPDDSVAKLDVQFGGLDFGSTGSAFNSVVQQQHGSNKHGSTGDMMYSSVTQQPMDNYGQPMSEKELVQNKSVSNQQQGDAGVAFQNQQQQRVVSSQLQQQQQQQQQGNSGPLISDSMSKSVPMSPPNLENQQLTGMSVQSQGQGSKIPVTQQSQQQPSPYTHAPVGISHGSAFVTYNTKPAPGFAAPGFAPVISQTQQTGPGAYNAIPTGQMYGSHQPSMVMTHTQQPSSGYGMGMSTYGSLPIVSASVQPSHIPGQAIPNQNMTQLSNSTSTYGVPAGIPYHSASTIPNSVAYNVGAASYNPYQKVNQMGSAGQLQQGVKETVNDVGSSSTTAATSTAQLSSAGLQGNTASTGASGKISSNVSTAGSTNSKQQTTTTGGGGGAAAGSMPPGMVYPQGYIVNQGLQGVPMYGFQGPMYSYDESQMQFLPRIPHPALAASYFDANASSFTPAGSGRSDGTTLQSYPGSDARFSRSDSSAASPVPSNLPGQATTPLYNIPQGGGYYYLGNNPMVHPGAFAQYAPPQMYQTTGLVTPNNPSGAPHTVSNHQYQNKGVSYGTSYINPYDTSAQQTGLTGVTDYVNKNTYSSSTGTGGSGGPNTTGGTGAKGSVSTAGSSQQSTDMSSSIYGGNKPHLNKMNNPYEKQQQYGGGSSGYNSMGQQANQLGGTGIGAPYNVYMQPAPVLSHVMFQDGSTGQRQGGQPKGGKQQQYSQQQYWSGN